MDYDSFRVGGFELGHLIVIFIVFGVALFVLYWLWVFPCGGQPLHGGFTSLPDPEVTSPSATTSRRSGDKPSGDVAVLYAIELEPGIVVLQNEDGDLFRILREYDSVNNNGSPTHGLPPGSSVPVHYIPAYTRAHVQNFPSAPPYTTAEVQPSTSSQSPWKPLCVQSGVDY